MTKSDPTTLTLTEFAAFMSVHYMTARKYALDGLLADYGAYRLPSGYWRIPRQGAEQFKAQLRNGAQPPAPAARKTPRTPKKTVKRPARKR